MKVKEIYKISETVHRAAGGKNRKYFPVFKYNVLGIACAYYWRGRIFPGNGKCDWAWNYIILYCRIYWNDYRIFWWKLLFI